MQLITHTQPHILIADEGKHICAINDIYESERIDKKTGKIIPEHFPHYATVIFPAAQIDTIEKVKELYVEETIKNEQ